MPKFAANLTMMFTEVDFLDRFKAAADAGFDAVEYLFPYGYDKDRLAEGLAEHGLKQVLYNLPAVDWGAGERDIPGFFLNRTDQALDLIQAVGHDNLFVQYDIYHMQIMEGDLAPTIEANLGRIAHVQLADTPGRHEPGSGEINYPFLFAHLDRIGYAGWIGCEYKPRATTIEGLGWFAPHARRARAA